MASSNFLLRYHWNLEGHRRLLRSALEQVVLTDRRRPINAQATLTERLFLHEGAPCCNHDPPHGVIPIIAIKQKLGLPRSALRDHLRKSQALVLCLDVIAGSALI